VGRVVQDLQIVLDAGPLVAAFAEPVIGKVEPRRREQIVTIGVLGEGARLANQRVNDMPVVDGVAIATHQPRQRVDLFVRIPDLDTIRKEPCFDFFADKPTMHRVDVAVNVDQAAAIDAAPHLQT
jgi:hypothetical protein